MADIDNEKAQFLLAAARILKWKHGTATWSTGRMTFNFDGVGAWKSVSIPVDHELAGWEDLSPLDKMGAAQSALRAAIAEYPTFDPTVPGWIEAGPAA